MVVTAESEIVNRIWTLTGGCHGWIRDSEQSEHWPVVVTAESEIVNTVIAGVVAAEPVRGGVGWTLSDGNVPHALLRLSSVTLFNFTQPLVLSAMVLILLASRFLVPDFSLLVPAPFLFSVHQHGNALPLPLRKELSLGSFKWNLKNFFLLLKTIDLPCFPFRAAVFLCLNLYLLSV